MRARIACACAAIAAVLAAAPADAGAGAPAGAAPGLARARARAADGRAGPLLRKLTDPTDAVVEDPASAFLCCGDSLRKPTSMALRGGDGGEMLSIVFISAEVAPWSVTGGLGAVRVPLCPPPLLGHDRPREHGIPCVLPRRVYRRWGKGGTFQCPLSPPPCASLAGVPLTRPDAAAGV